ncbi:hypothetical protein MCBMB27_05827 (plasmid) [Methylobacterium phyllosphaerae]|uniref:Uncharacterized protein n=2 Tax=Methylobacterium phyllosphaerae TaxID=418223 RepID=A0AAE8L9E5_9HYPH|nr:hypothetical protein MCBMB27_05827 [Methylobacterium phyllosphaerae]SFH62534.1 hypothetical protein SAMN05192567_13730 [Methylobacterium phyllosphaerae]
MGATNMKLDDDFLRSVIGGANGGGYWDHSGKISMYVTPVPGNVIMSGALDRNSVRKNDQGVYMKWDRTRGCETPAPKLR